MISWSSSRISGGSAGVVKMVLLAFAGTEPHSIENSKPPCIPNILVLFWQVIRAVGDLSFSACILVYFEVIKEELCRQK